MRLERIKRGMSQTDLFLKTGIPQWRVSLIERGIPPKIEEAKKIAEVFRVNPADFFPAFQNGNEVGVVG